MKKILFMSLNFAFIFGMNNNNFKMNNTNKAVLPFSAVKVCGKHMIYSSMQSIINCQSSVGKESNSKKTIVSSKELLKQYSNTYSKLLGEKNYNNTSRDNDKEKKELLDNFDKIIDMMKKNNIPCDEDSLCREIREGTVTSDDIYKLIAKNL